MDKELFKLVRINDNSECRAYKFAKTPNYSIGVWSSEPDKVVWVDKTTNFDCMIVRSYTTGTLCGYVGVPATHPLHGTCADELIVSPQVHGGLTFSGKCFEGASEEYCLVCHTPSENGEVWWFGFDCAHYCDVAPMWCGMFMDKKSTYKDIQFVTKEVEELALHLLLQQR